MAAPATLPITLTINGNDETTYVPFDSISLERYTLDVDYLSFTIDDPQNTVLKGHTVKLSSGGTLLFIGFVAELEDRKRDNGITKQYVIRAADYKQRLRRAVLPYLELTGTDASILAALLSNAYPDLSSLFDFSTGVNNLLNDLAFDTNNDDLLSAITRFADENGVGNLSFTPTLAGDAQTNYFYNPQIDYTSDPDQYVRGDPSRTSSLTAGTNGGTVTGFFPVTGGQVTVNVSNPGVISGNSARITSFLTSGPNDLGYITIGESAGGFDSVLDVPASSSFDYMRCTFYFRYGDGGNDSADLYPFVHAYSTGGAYVETFASQNADFGTSLASDWAIDDASFPTIADATWHRVAIDLYLPDASDYASGFKLVFGIKAFFSGGTATYMEVSNILVELSSTALTAPLSATTYFDGDTTGYSWNGTTDNSTSGKDGTNDGLQLNWNATPPAAAFNLDIGSGDEFAHDINLSVGDLDDFNSAFVVGGNEQVAITWTYESDGEQDHIDLETFVKDLTVEQNDGTDGTPSWTSLTVGVWGKDVLSSKQVLYDTEKHWLYFATNPPALAKSIRITGTIPRPVRVRVDSITGASEPTLAATIVDESITSEDEAIQVAESELARRNNPTKLTFTTYEPGLLPGRTINVTDSARGLNVDVVIQRIQTRWIGASGHVEHRVDCGPEQPTDASVLLARTDARTRGSVKAQDITTPAFTPLQDEDGTVLVDENGQTLYDET